MAAKSPGAIVYAGVMRTLAHLHTHPLGRLALFLLAALHEIVFAWPSFSSRPRSG